MASDKRSLINFDDKDNFPGKINPDTNNYEFPKLYQTTASKKVREWTVYVRLIKEASKSTKESSKQGWNLMIEDQIPIKPEYLTNQSKLSGSLAEVWTESGVINMKIVRSAVTYKAAVNVGKANERNPLQSALVFARGKFLKKKDEGCVEDINELSKVADEEKIDHNIMFFPMLAKNYKDNKNISYPIYVQPKLDGNRCVVYLNKIENPTYKNVVMYSRQKKEYPSNESNDNIRKEILDLLVAAYDKKNKASIFIGGELYIHNVSLQDINSEVRGSDSKKNIQYHIYDCFYPYYKDEPFKDRYKFLERLYNDNIADSDIIKLVKTDLIENADDHDSIYKKYISDNYEGIIIRNPDGAYAKSAVKKSEQLRSKNLLKQKEVFDDEFEVVGYTTGISGKETSLVIWVCLSKNKDKDTFTVVPNMSHEERNKILLDCKKNFAKKYKGRLMTVEYRGLSDNNIPLQCKAIGFRDFK